MTSNSIHLFSHTICGSEVWAQHSSAGCSADGLTMTEIKMSVWLVLLWSLGMSFQVNLSFYGCRTEVPVSMSARGCPQLLEASHMSSYEVLSVFKPAMVHQVLTML